MMTIVGDHADSLLDGTFGVFCSVIHKKNYYNPSKMQVAKKAPTLL